MIAIKVPGGTNAFENEAKKKALESLGKFDTETLSLLVKLKESARSEEKIVQLLKNPMAKTLVK